MCNKKMIILVITTFLVLSELIIVLNNSKNNSLIGTYIDGEYSSTIPSKDSGYVVEKITCDNGVVGDWNYDNWGLLATNITKKAKCNVYLKKGIRLADVNTYVDDTGKCPSVNSDGTVNVIGAESENSLLCNAPDNYGTSYYFRGNVQNNYVKFANFYWQIVRINGDNSIRLIYDGTTAYENGEASEDRIIGYSAFNEKYDDNAYVGYMYGTPGSSTYEETHANINDSTIKKYIDTWYENNLKNTKYEENLVDNIFCNDRYIPIINNNSNLGFKANSTFYRWYYGPWTSSGIKQSSDFKCEGNDAFGVNQGNKSFKYGIGLINEDEALLAGGFVASNKGYYLYDGINYWTMTPYIFDNNVANVRAIVSNGVIHVAYNVNTTNAVKPVINLKPNSLKSGDGTIDNPYTVE